MPAFVKSAADETIWKKAVRAAHHAKAYNIYAFANDWFHKQKSSDKKTEDVVNEIILLALQEVTGTGSVAGAEGGLGNIRGPGVPSELPKQRALAQQSRKKSMFARHQVLKVLPKASDKIVRGPDEDVSSPELQRMEKDIEHDEQEFPYSDEPK